MKAYLRSVLEASVLALRFLYAIPRFSEDLDFAVERPDRGYDFRAYLKAIRSDLEREGYEVEVKVNDRRIVHKAFVKFPGLLFEMGLSPHRSETLAIKPLTRLTSKWAYIDMALLVVPPPGMRKLEPGAASCKMKMMPFQVSFSVSAA